MFLKRKYEGFDDVIAQKKRKILEKWDEWGKKCEVIAKQLDTFQGHCVDEECEDCEDFLDFLDNFIETIVYTSK